MKQPELFKLERVKRDRLFRRPESRYWQARFYANGHWHRRSTSVTHKGSAMVALLCWKEQYEKRGAPRPNRCFADQC